jgi:hypothetical protein
MNWLKLLVEQHSELESPRNFWYWSGLVAISAVVKDQVYLDRGGVYKLYPNIYVMLHADSGLKKGPPVALAKDLVKKVNNTRIISGRSSIQGILKELGTAYSLPGGKVISKSVGFIVASEFSSSLVSDPAAMTILTDLYDRQYNEGEYRSLLKMETFQLKDPTISMLVATNEAHFEDFIQGKDIKGGFIGRMFVIAENKVQRLNSLVAPLRNPPNRAQFAEYLKEISNLQGPFRPFGSLEESDEFSFKKVKITGTEYFTEAGKLYDDWYEEFYTSIAQSEDKDPTGTVQRFGDTVLKVAMLLSLADSPSLVLQKDHIVEALSVTESLIGNVRRTTIGKRGKSEFADKKAMILKELVIHQKNHQITRTALLRKYSFDLRAIELDEIMQEFDSAGYILTKMMGNQVVYEMPEKYANQLKAHFQGKAK